MKKNYSINNDGSRRKVQNVLESLDARDINHTMRKIEWRYTNMMSPELRLLENGSISLEPASNSAEDSVWVISDESNISDTLESLGFDFNEENVPIWDSDQADNALYSLLEWSKALPNDDSFYSY